MSEQGKLVTRQEIYEAVWQTPLSKLAPVWGTTAAEITRACDEMNVRRPGSGHWTLVRRGSQVERPPLPPPEADTPAAVVVEPAIERVKPKPAEQAYMEKWPKVAVPKNLSHAHPLVKQTKKAFSDATSVHNGFIDARSGVDRPLRLMVSPGAVDRALRILDAIIKGIIERGGRFERGPESWRLRLFMGKQPVEFYVREIMNRRDRQFTAEEREAPGFSYGDKYDWLGSGRLRFRIRNGEWLYEQDWDDSKKLKLEDQVGEIIETLANVEEKAKQNRAAREEWERRLEEAEMQRREERRKQERIQEEAEDRRRVEKENRKRLEEKARAWREARILRRFICACEGALRKEGTALPALGWEARWLAWARDHANRLDPMTSGFLEEEKQRVAVPEGNGVSGCAARA